MSIVTVYYNLKGETVLKSDKIDTLQNTSKVHNNKRKITE